MGHLWGRLNPTPGIWSTSWNYRRHLWGKLTPTTISTFTSSKSSSGLWGKLWERCLILHTWTIPDTMWLSHFEWIKIIILTKLACGLLIKGWHFIFIIKFRCKFIVAISNFVWKAYVWPCNISPSLCTCQQYNAEILTNHDTIKKNGTIWRISSRSPHYGLNSR